MADYPRLKMTGYESASQIDSIFGSFMVDVAYIDEITDDCIFIYADDDIWPADQRDYEWLCSTITETLNEHGIKGANLELVPANE
jgi:hypothetical protein